MAGYKDFTTMQLKRATEFFEGVEYFAKLKSQTSENPMKDGIEEVLNYYKQKSSKRDEKNLDLVMTTGETVLNQEDLDNDPVFEQDFSEEEEDIKEKMKDKKVHKLSLIHI